MTFFDFDRGRHSRQPGRESTTVTKPILIMLTFFSFPVISAQQYFAGLFFAFYTNKAQTQQAAVGFVPIYNKTPGDFSYQEIFPTTYHFANLY